MSTFPALTVEQGFKAMRIFLKAYWIEGNRQDEELMLLFGGMDQRNGDPAHFDSWVRGVRKFTGTEVPEI